MLEAPRPIRDLHALLKELDGRSFKRYRTLLHQAFYHDRYLIRFIHVQGSPGAFPASVCHLILKNTELGLPDGCLSNTFRRTATADYLLRAFGQGVRRHARQNRGVQGSGSFQPLPLPPQVLHRNVVRFQKTEVYIAFHISLPGSLDNRILGAQAVRMFEKELDGIFHALKASVTPNARLIRHCDAVEDMLSLQSRLARYGLVAFVGDGAILPRGSGVSQAPLREGAVAFQAPGQLAVALDLPNAGRVRGLGIRPGVTVLIGSAFHGKTTLLDALSKGVYPHIPGDGREQVVTHPDTAVICAEEGRAVNGLDISGFIDNLPGDVDARRFWTQNASGSTSEAAAIIEAVLAGAKVLLLDEDTSAANFLFKDQHMRGLIPEDSITPFFDRVQELHHQWGVSTLLVAGGSSEYLGVAHQVIAMHNYRPVCMTDRVRRLALAKPRKPAKRMIIADKRRVLADNFDPSYHASRLAKTVDVRIKPLRLQEKILEFGNQQLDLTNLSTLVDPHQVLAIGQALLLARKRFGDAMLSPSALAGALSELIQKEGLDILLPGGSGFLFLASPRRLELAAAINRLRSLQVKIIET